MKRYLSTAQVADRLGISRDALNARIRAGDFAEPDVVVGDRFQGWSEETVELILQQAEGDRTLCVPEAAAELVTTVRQIAECVRAYGDSSSDSTTGIHHSVPAALHVISAKLEHMIRAIVAMDHKHARLIRGLLDTDPSIHEETPIAFTFGAVPSIAAAVETDDQTRSGRLRLAADLAGSVIVQMPNVMRTRETRAAMAALGAERDKIIAHADLLGVGA